MFLAAWVPKGHEGQNQRWGPGLKTLWKLCLTRKPLSLQCHNTSVLASHHWKFILPISQQHKKVGAVYFTKFGFLGTVLVCKKTFAAALWNEGPPRDIAPVQFHTIPILQVIQCYIHQRWHFRNDRSPTTSTQSFTRCAPRVCVDFYGALRGGKARASLIYTTDPGSHFRFINVANFT